MAGPRPALPLTQLATMFHSVGQYLKYLKEERFLPCCTSLPRFRLIPESEASACVHAGTHGAHPSLCRAPVSIAFFAMCFTAYPPEIRPIYGNVSRRRFVFHSRGSPLLESWPEPFRNINRLVTWLGRAFFNDSEHFEKHGLSKCGDQCWCISEQQLVDHNKWWRTQKHPALLVYKNNQGYLHIQLRNPPGVAALQPNPRPIGIHHLLCWWYWGPPQGFLKVACHFACEVKHCLCPRHLR